MKILMVAIPNHHFFQWVNQLKGAGFDVYWFDVTDGGPKSEKIEWVKQIKGWKLKCDFPLRHALKKHLPKMYRAIQKYNENSVEKAFKATYEAIEPDIVHCFEMQLSGLPILSIMEQNKTPFVYSSWGSDLFYFRELGLTNHKVQTFLKRIDYLITDCKRDHGIAVKNGFSNNYLGVFPGNGGLKLDIAQNEAAHKREIILIKGYDDGVGKASVVLNALGLLPKSVLENKQIVVYSADKTIEKQITDSKFLSDLNITVFSRYAFVENKKLLGMMGKAMVHIGNSLSDGMPNALLEAMGMGAFPIQSNPGHVTEEVIADGKNGLLIRDALNANEIAEHIKRAINNEELRKSTQSQNIDFIQKQYGRNHLKPKIVELYQNIKRTFH
ncbi:glycosyltransferase family 4 protein [Tamlana crocina]|uniref:Glycosyltransferase family 4 protein n=1 Tax=Tamlana crocina TaxID=393006 RepID=A0ABX1DAH2_9FLAO|nr:glycosyltransferase family 4 protein [Tamlana crocina]NJX15042.1 glycosyltransferase family 4 protein [Tamlana crocina]